MDPRLAGKMDRLLILHCSPLFPPLMLSTDTKLVSVSPSDADMAVLQTAVPICIPTEAHATSTQCPNMWAHRHGTFSTEQQTGEFCQPFSDIQTFSPRGGDVCFNNTYPNPPFEVPSVSRPQNKH